MEMKMTDQTLRFVEAVSDEIKEAIYRLRYRIYVEECGFERREDHPHGVEMDEYDRHAIHFAALNDIDEVIGTVRMVMHSEKGFPIEKATKMRFLGKKPPPHRIAEVSRLALLPAYRRRADHDPYNAEFYFRQSPYPEEEATLVQCVKIKRSVVVLSLVGLVYEMSKRLGVTHLYMITERKLWYMLNRHGFLFHQIGEPVEYHGLRIPYLGIISEMEDYLLYTNPELLMHSAFRIAMEATNHPPRHANRSLAANHHPQPRYVYQ
jgi:N-acyl amino acid synthase of PEP-CTERM/exosortase system